MQQPAQRQHDDDLDHGGSLDLGDAAPAIADPLGQLSLAQAQELSGIGDVCSLPPIIRQLAQALQALDDMFRDLPHLTKPPMFEGNRRVR